MTSVESQRTGVQSDTPGEVEHDESISDAPCGILSCRLDGTIIGVSGHFVTWTGYPRMSLLNLQKFQDLIDPSDRLFFEANYLPKLLQGHQPSVWPCQIVCMDGTTFTALVSSNVKRSFSGDVDEIRLALLRVNAPLPEHDGHRHGLDGASNATEKYRNAMVAGGFGAWETDFSTGQRFWTPEGLDLFDIAHPLEQGQIGGDHDELLNRMHPEDRHLLAEFHRRMIAEDAFSVDYRINRADGETRWISGRSKVLSRDCDGNPVTVIHVASDITQRKAVEAELAEKANFIQAIVNSTPASIYVFNCLTQTNEMITNRAAELLGYNHDQWKQMLADAIDLMHPDDRAGLAEYFENFAAQPQIEPRSYEHRMWHADGSWHTFLSRDVIYERLPDGRVSKILGTSIDITDRKASEDRLRESETFSSALIEASPDCLKIIGPDGRVQFVNENGVRLLDFTERAQLVGRPWEQIWPHAQRDMIEKAIATALSGQSVRFGATAPTVKGTIKTWDVIVAPVRAKDGTVIRLIASSRDITEKIQADNLLRESQSRLSAALRAGPIGVHDYDVRTGQFIWDDTTRRLWGMSSDENITSEKFASGVHPDDMPALQAAADRAFDPKGDRRYAVEYRVISRDGTVRWVFANGDVEFDGDIPVRLVGTVRDISDRKCAEDRLKASEDRLVRAQHAARIGTWDWDMVNDLAYWTDEAWNLFGKQKTAEPITYQSWLSCIHPEDRVATVDAYNRSLISGVYHCEHRVVGEGQTERWAESRGETMFDADRRPVRMVGTIQDITQRKQSEQHIQLLMLEVNHRAKNLLTVVQAVARYTARSGDPATFIERLSDRIAGLAGSHDLLVHNEWRGVEMRELVLAQLRGFSELRQGRVTIDGPKIDISATSAQAIGMALHELATNASKYGALSNATGRVEITWTVEHDTERSMSLTWSEIDGPRVVVPTKKGFGHSVIMNMAEASTNGNVQVNYAPEGFRWSIKAPIALNIVEHI